MARSKSLRFWGLLGVGALLYAPHLPAPFVADDHFIFWRLQEGGIFGFATRPPTGFYRPLISLQYYLDYWLWGIQPLWSHLVDLAWHLLCAWLVAIFCKVWLIDNGWSGDRASRAALLAMALFLVLPAHVEAVAWFAARADLVATGAAIVCLLLLWANVRCERRLYAWLALLCFAGGLFTKESLLTFPFVVWLWLRWLGVARAGWRTLPFWGVVGLFWWLRAQAVAGLGAYPAAWETLHQPWQMGIHLMVYLLQLPMPTILFGLGRDGLDTLLWLSWAIGAILLSVGWRKAPSPRSSGWLMPMFALLSLLPVLLFKPSPWHFLNSRYSYLASVWLVVWASGWLMESWERAQWARWGTSLLLLTYAMGTLRQASDWATAGHIARSTLQSLRELPTDRPIVLISVPDHYRGAYIWRAGFEEAVRLMAPERAHLPLYALSRFTMRLSPDTAVLYSAGEAHLSRQEDIFLPPEGLPLPPQGIEWRVQPERVVIAPDWTRPYLLLRYEDGRFLPVR